MGADAGLEDLKAMVGREVAQRVADGQTIGAGTGTTVDAALREIAARVAAEKLNVAFVPTSLETAWYCEELGLKVLAAGCRAELAWGFDGADAVNRRLWAVKGKGGAMLGEKIMAARCREYLLIIDEGKFVDNIVEKVPVPVEVLPEAVMLVEHGLRRLGAGEVRLRQAVNKHGPVITERGNVIFDAAFREVYADLERDIKALTGVVESGLFLNYATEVLIGTPRGVRRILRS